MIGGGPSRALPIALAAAVLWPTARPSMAEEAGGAAAAAAQRAALPAEPRPIDPLSSYPLVLLVQADAVLASTPATEAPDDPRAGASLRLRRVRVGDDLRFGRFRLRALFEGQSDDGAGQTASPVEGGRIPFGGPMRATEAYLSWTPARAFHFDAGELRVPFSLSRQVDEGALRLPERPGFVSAFLPDYRAGVAIGGDLGELLYQAAFLSADPALDRRLFESGGLAAGRLTAEPLGPVGLEPWRLPADDPWYGWFRFAVGLSFLYGTVLEPRTLAIDPDFTVQWRRLVATAEYLFAHTPSGNHQGTALEPGVTLFARRLDVVARGEWERANGADLWGVGAGLTGYAPDARLRVTVAFERRRGSAAAGAPTTDSGWALVRLTIAVD